MKPLIHVEKVREEQVTPNDLPVDLIGHDPHTNQDFKGHFIFSNGQLQVKEYTTSDNKKLSTKFSTHIVAFLKKFEEDYRGKN